MSTSEKAFKLKETDLLRFIGLGKAIDSHMSLMILTDGKPKNKMKAKTKNNPEITYGPQALLRGAMRILELCGIDVGEQHGLVDGM